MNLQKIENVFQFEAMKEKMFKQQCS